MVTPRTAAHRRPRASCTSTPASISHTFSSFLRFHCACQNPLIFRSAAATAGSHSYPSPSSRLVVTVCTALRGVNAPKYSSCAATITVS